MGISEASAPALHSWFLPRTKRRRGKSAAPAPDASEAISLLGAAMHWDVVVVILQWIKARLRPGIVNDRDPGTVAEHFAGVAVPTPLPSTGQYRPRRHLRGGQEWLPCAPPSPD